MSPLPNAIQGQRLAAAVIQIITLLVLLPAVTSVANTGRSLMWRFKVIVQNRIVAEYGASIFTSDSMCSGFLATLSFFTCSLLKAVLKINVSKL